MSRKPSSRNIAAIDLFCGAGGLTYGMEKAGIKVKLGIDADPECEYAYTKNNSAGFLLSPIEKITGTQLRKIFSTNAIRVLAGCAPCQTFSSYYQKARRTDARWELLTHFARLVGSVHPHIVTMENVPGLVHKPIFQQFVDKLQRNGFYIDHKIVNCSDYGIPQHRHRLVLLASRLGPIKLLTPLEVNAKLTTVYDAIGQLPAIKAGESDANDQLHTSPALSLLNEKRIHASTPDGTWRDWNYHLRANCHKKKSGKSYPGVYGRMSWSKPAPTITTQFFGFGNGRFGHPKQNRAISLREGAILQSFPKHYKFIPKSQPVTKKLLGRLIGNAVPVKLAKVIGKSIITHVDVCKSNLGTNEGTTI